MTTTTRLAECTAMTTTLFLALELGDTRWQLAFAVTRAARPRLRTITAGDLAALWREMAAAQERFGVGPEAPVRSCYEARPAALRQRTCLSGPFAFRLLTSQPSNPVRVHLHVVPAPATAP